MEIKSGFKSYIALLIILNMLLFTGCNSSDLKYQGKVEVENQDIKEIDSKQSKNKEENTNEEADIGEGLEVIDGNPIGEYKASGVTDFMIIKTDPETNNSRPVGFLEEEHPYIKEISNKLDDLFIILYEIDYKTLTEDRHEKILKGQLDEDSEYLKVSGAIDDQVITQVTNIKINSVDFQDGMEQARISSEITYHVLQSLEQESVWNKYLEGKNFIANAVSEMERIDGKWEVVHVLELTVKVLEDDN